jgi:hypothetical protein
MEYRPGNLFQDLMVNLTFWPGWIVTIGLIGSGVMELLDGEVAEDEPSEPRSNAWQVERGPTPSTSERPQAAWAPSEAQAPTAGRGGAERAEGHNPAAGWYADPAGSEALRYWDGQRWGTELRAAPDRT